MRAMSEGVQLNNEGVRLNGVGQHAQALPLFRRALAIKEAAYGVGHYHCLITMSGVADALLGLRRLDEAETEAKRMQQFALALGSSGKDQARIAGEILRDVERGKKRQK